MGAPLRLVKDEVTHMPEGTVVMFPIKIRKGDSVERTRLTIRLGEPPKEEGKKKTTKDEAKAEKSKAAEKENKEPKSAATPEPKSKDKKEKDKKDKKEKDK